jgi:hypothetical protein
MATIRLSSEEDYMHLRGPAYCSQDLQRSGDTCLSQSTADLS